MDRKITSSLLRKTRFYWNAKNLDLCCVYMLIYNTYTIIHRGHGWRNGIGINNNVKILRNHFFCGVQHSWIQFKGCSFNVPENQGSGETVSLSNFYSCLGIEILAKCYCSCEYKWHRFLTYFINKQPQTNFSINGSSNSSAMQGDCHWQSLF